MAASPYVRSLVGVLGSISVAEFLERYDVKQKDLADLLGVDQNSITRWKKGETPPDRARHLAAIAAHLDNQAQIAQMIRAAAQFIEYNQGLAYGMVQGKSLSAYEFALLKRKKQAISA